MKLTEIQIFLDSIESILYDIFINKNTNFTDSYNIIYKFTFNNINTIIYKDILDYTYLILKKIYIQLHDTIENKFIVEFSSDRDHCEEYGLDKYIYTYNELLEHCGYCNKLFAYYIQKIDGNTHYYTELHKQLWIKYIYKPLKFNINTSIIYIIDTNYEIDGHYEMDIGKINKVNNYFKILNKLEVNEGEYKTDMKGYLFKQFFTSSLTDFFITKLNKTHTKIVELDLIDYTIQLNSIYNKNRELLKLYGLETYYYEYYYIFHSFLDVPKMIIEHKLKELPVLIKSFYNKLYTKFLNNDCLNDKIVIDSLFVFLNIFMYNFYTIIDNDITTFIKDIVYNIELNTTHFNFEVFLFNSYFIDDLYTQLKEDYSKYYSLNILDYSLKIKKTYTTITEHRIHYLSRINDKDLVGYCHHFIKSKIYNGLFPINIFVNSIAMYMKYNEEDTVDEILIYYRNYLIQRLLKNSSNKDIITKELIIIEGLQKCFNYNMLSKLYIICKDLLKSIDIGVEFNIIYNMDISNSIIIATDGIWGIDIEGVKEPNYSNILFNSSLNNFRQTFDHYYTKQKYENKKLKWVDTLSTCNIDYRINDTIITLDNCCLKQANLLYNYNTCDFIEENDCSDYELLTLKLFCKLKIILKNNNRFSVNREFKPKTVNPTFNIKSIFGKYKKHIMNK